MAKPRIFISSTYYDLKHLRSSLDLFIESLGFESILSEKGDIAFTPDTPLDESCYREASNADVFCLIIGGRYGSESSGKVKKDKKGFFERYDSITKKEYEEAVKKDIPTYILIESSVYSEYHTYLRNKGSSDVHYAHVDSENIFKLIEDILSKPKNNPVHTFEKFADIETWLREQWAGLFRELLHRMSNQKQIGTLSAQVDDLKEINNTLKRYLENVMSKVSPDDSPDIIRFEEERLEERERNKIIMENSWTDYILSEHRIDLDEYIQVMKDAKSFDDFAKIVGNISPRDDSEEDIENTLEEFSDARTDFNKTRKILGLPIFKMRKK